MGRTGSPNDKAGGHYNRAFALAMSDDEGSTSKVVGVQLHHLHRSPKAPVKPGQQQQPAGGAAGVSGKGRQTRLQSLLCGAR